MTLSRYILREHLAPFVYGLSLIVFIFVMNLFFQLLGKIVGKGIPVMVIGEFFFLNLAWILTLAVPMAVLIATLAAFGRLSADGEITALRSAGLSPWQLVRPVLAAGLVVAVLVGLFNNYVLPDMNHRTKLLTQDINRKRPTLNLEPGVFNFDIPNLVLHAGTVNPTTGEMGGVTIFDETQPDRRATITASSGVLRFAPESESVVLTLFDGDLHQPSAHEVEAHEWTKFDSVRFRTILPGMVLRRAGGEVRGDREMSVQEMVARVRELRAAGGEWELKRAAAFMVEIHKKFAIPAACLVFVILGAPLGMMTRRGGLGVSAGVSLLFFIIYWAMLVNGEDLADRGVVSPAVAMWSADVLMGVAGLYLMHLVKRRSALPTLRVPALGQRRRWFVGA